MMKVSSVTPNCYSMKLRNSANENKKQNTAQEAVSQNNINFKGALTLATATAFGMVAGATLMYLYNIDRNKPKIAEQPKPVKSDNMIKETDSTFSLPVSDVDNMGVYELSAIKIIQAPAPSVRELGYVGFMYKGKPYTTHFYYQKDTNLQIAILDKLKEIDPEKAGMFVRIQSDIIKKEKFDKKCNELEYPNTDLERPYISESKKDNLYMNTTKYGIGNVKILQIPNAYLGEHGYVTFMYNGGDYIASFTENDRDSVRKAIQEKIKELNY